MEHSDQRLQVEMDELRRSRTRLLLAADADRRSIERALHDGLQQQLAALAFDLRRVSDTVEEDPAAARASLDALAALVRDAIAEAARLAHWIYPPRLLDMRELARAVRVAADGAGVALTVQVSTTVPAAPATIAGIYWLCVEALAEAPPGTNATVKLGDGEEGIRFDVEVAGAYSEGRLERVRDRVEALGGRLTVEDEEDGRSRVEGTVPSAWS